MKIILATPIYPPDIGGPAIYSQRLKEGLERLGYEITVISYQGLKIYPQPLRLFIYFLKLFSHALRGDIIYSLNLISCGVPSCFTAKILRKKIFIRIGGDFLWERAVESGKTKKPLREYYLDQRSLKEKSWVFLMKAVFNCADKIIFTSKFQRDIYLKTFNIKEEKMDIVQNPFPDVKGGDQLMSGRPQLLFAGRLIKLKNIDFLIRVFHNVLKRTGRDLTLKIIGDGPEKDNLKVGNKVIISQTLSHEELLQEIQRCYLCILPSLTEITPNFALECIKLKKPILLTQETGLYEIFKDDLIFLDPKDEEDTEKKITRLLDIKNYQDYVEKINNIPTSYSWEDVIEKHISLFKKS
ncbi:MAG: glycosyltransferase family 4 protein [Candidatus Nealsonbacteria bacterium]